MPIVIDPDHFLRTETGRLWTEARGREAWAKAFDALDTELARRAKGACRVVVVCGLQGAGKTHWIHRHGACDEATIYFDAALPGARHRRPIVEIARRHGASIEVVWMDTPLDVALARNARRPVDEVVPEASIKSVARLFEPPDASEGFARIRVVRECAVPPAGVLPDA